MSSKIKKEFLLEGLDCANCASKIETQVNEIDGVANVHLNFITKTLAIESASDGNMDEIVDKTSEIIKRLEPSVVVKEKIVNRSTKKALLLMGLS